ncbi:MAG TPA: alpha/beta family hydrolase [Chthoniobacterales bacterium]|nr:alpha/beta family hydrolase [Chthoniobacterales bacterium]
MRTFFLFAPGAGAASSHPWMRRWKEQLSTQGEVKTFDYDYMREGRKRPDPLPRLIERHRQALAEARAKTSAPIVLIGKSMGARVGCHLALQESVSGIICLGYPLCGSGDQSKLRDKVLLDLRTPILFVQGTRDPLCPLDLLDAVRANMSVPNFLHVVEGGDHSLLVRKKDLATETQEDVDQRILEAISHFASASNSS